MQHTIHGNNVSGTIDDFTGYPSLKLEVILSDVKLIPNYSWVTQDIAYQTPHCTNAPALMSHMCYWFINGSRYYDTKSFCQAANHDDETSLLWYLTYGDSLPSNPNDVKSIHTSYKL